MSDSLAIAVAQLNPVVGDIAGNLRDNYNLFSA